MSKIARPTEEQAEAASQWRRARADPRAFATRYAAQWVRFAAGHGELRHRRRCRRVRPSSRRSTRARSDALLARMVKTSIGGHSSDPARFRCLASQIPGYLHRGNS